MNTFERLESVVRSYCRSFPVVFDRARGSELFDTSGRRYLDFFAGAGALNYGHNNPHLKEKLVEYLSGDHIVHSLDMFSQAKRDFLDRFDEAVLRPRKLSYKVQFPGPTGTNAVEAALKLARKVTERQHIIGFTNAFHGMTLGSLGVSGNSMKRDGAGLSLHGATNLPYDGYLGPDHDTIEVLSAMLQDSGSGLETPAAVILETVQAEGGLNTASKEWLQRLQALCREHGILLIIDDIQVGVGRTGPFFSFEEAGIEPDIVTLSKSLSGYGLPFAVTLLRPDLDVWQPGEHNGTFRGFNPAMVTATAALNEFWRDDKLQRDVTRKSAVISARLHQFIQRYPELEATQRGRGMIQGLACKPGLAEKISRLAFDRGLIIETSGADSDVVKLLPSLTISDDGLNEGLDILEASLAEAVDVEVRDRQLAGSAR